MSVHTHRETPGEVWTCGRPHAPSPSHAYAKHTFIYLSGVLQTLDERETPRTGVHTSTRPQTTTEEVATMPIDPRTIEAADELRELVTPLARSYVQHPELIPILIGDDLTRLVEAALGVCILIDLADAGLEVTR